MLLPGTSKLDPGAGQVVRRAMAAHQQVEFSLYSLAITRCDDALRRVCAGFEHVGLHQRQIDERQRLQVAVLHRAAPEDRQMRRSSAEHGGEVIGQPRVTAADAAGHQSDQRRARGPGGRFGFLRLPTGSPGSRQQQQDEATGETCIGVDPRLGDGASARDAGRDRTAGRLRGRGAEPSGSDPIRSASRWLSLADRRPVSPAKSSSGCQFARSAARAGPGSSNSVMPPVAVRT